MSIFTRAIDAMTDRQLRNEAERLEEVQGEIARRADVREHATETAASEATAKKNASRVLTLTELLVSTEVEIEEATARLDTAVRGLQNFEVRDGLQVRHRAILDELRVLGSPSPEPNFKGLSEEAIKTAERVFTPLGCDLGITVTARPMLVYR